MSDQVAQIGRRAALAAGAVMRQNYLRPHDITYKGAIDPVTETDFQAQEIILAIISKAFPHHAFLAEEQSEDQSPAQGAAARWIIDPVDGTVNYAHGFPMFCVSIAFESEGSLEYGVIYDPLRDELFEARQGRGASLNGQAIQVSARAALDHALVATGFPYDVRQRLSPTLERLGRVLAQTEGLRRAGSAALDLCYVACGRFDGFYEENLKPWDTAAGILLVAEAGGRISTFTGGPYDITSPNIVASNGSLHAGLLTIVQLK
jgi:myo-inositol-1(or 4)-monophosphatase